MKKRLLSLSIIFSLYVFHVISGFAADEKTSPKSSPGEGKEAAAKIEYETITLKVPIFSPLFSSFPLAVVNNETITVEDFKEAIGSLHKGIVEEKTAVKKQYPDLLKRLVNAKLILQEARNIGLEELPEVKQLVDTFSKIKLRELLQKQYVKDIKPDEAEVEKLYKEEVREWKIKSVLLEKEDDARKLEEDLRKGNNFDEATGKLIEGGLAKGEKEGVYQKSKELLPQIAKVASEMKTGSVSPVIPVKSGFVIFKLEEVRYPENPDAREEARQQALSRKRVEALVKYNKELSKKYIKLNKRLVDSLDFESKNPGFENLLSDKRVLAEIKGDRPVTVAELTEALKDKFYHNVEEAIKSKKVNKKKTDVLQEILGKRVQRLEALKKGIDRTEKFKKMVKDYEDSVLFGTFVRKVIVPEVKVGDGDMKAYYNEHISEFTTPEMVRIKAIVFKKMADAETALDKLRKGEDFNWLRENAEGQVEKNTQGLLPFDGNILIKSELPEGVQKALSGAHPEDYRLYESPERLAYVLNVLDVIPPRPQPYEEMKDIIAEKAFKEKVDRAVEEWASKLRGASDIAIYATDFDEK